MNRTEHKVSNSEIIIFLGELIFMCIMDEVNHDIQMATKRCTVACMHNNNLKSKNYSVDYMHICRKRPFLCPQKTNDFTVHTEAIYRV